MQFDRVTCTTAMDRGQQAYEAVDARYRRQRALLEGLNDRRLLVGGDDQLELQLLGAIVNTVGELIRLAVDLECWYTRLGAVAPETINTSSAQLYKAVATALRDEALQVCIQRLTLTRSVHGDSSELEYAYGDLARLGNEQHSELALLAILGIRQRRYGARSEGAAYAHWLLAGFYARHGRTSEAAMQQARELEIRNLYRRA